MGVIANDPKLQAQLSSLLEQAEARVEELEGQLTAARRERDALAALVDKRQDDAAKPLSGDSLRREAHRLLREADPAQQGVHYQEITRMLLERGFRIAGVSPDKAPNVRSTIGAGERAAKMFRPVGRENGDFGKYTWI